MNAKIRHRRRRRLNRQLSRVDALTCDCIRRRIDNTGRAPRWSTPIEVMATLRRYGGSLD